MAKRISLVLAGLVVALFAYALWLRTTSLEALPEVNGDEVWHAIQLTRMARGESFSLLTESNLILSPIHVAMELPFLLIFSPSLWVVRLPAVVSGIMAVVCMYVLGSRIFDRTTALIASALLAVLPASIIFSRISYENAHAPLYGILLIYLLDRRRMVAAVLLLTMIYFVHPTNLFLLPVLLGVVIVRTYEEFPDDPARATRKVLVRGGAVASVVMLIGGLTMLNPATKRLSEVSDTGLHGRHDFLEFCAHYERLFMGAHYAAAPLRTGLFWTVFLLLFSVGLWRLVSARQWDRATLAVSSILAALALFVMGGSNIIMPSSARYGLYLLTPTCLAIGCLANALVVKRESERLAWLRPVQFAGILALGWCLILTVDLTRITKWSFMAGDYHNEQESPWTFGSDARPPLRQVSSLIAHDVDARARETGLRSKAAVEPTVVHAHAWWAYGPLEWLAVPRPDIKVVNFDWLPPNEAERTALLKESLLRGGYVVTYATPPTLEPFVQRLFPTDSLKKWEIPQSTGQPYLVVLRLKWNAPELARAEVGAGSGRTVRK